MTIKEVSLRRVFNLGNYETLHVELKASINESIGEDVQDILAILEKKAEEYVEER